MGDTHFLPRDEFAPPSPGYALLPFRFERWGQSERLLVSEAGEFTWLASGEFDAFVAHRVLPASLHEVDRHPC